MSNFFVPFFITLLSGLSTVIGAFIIFIKTQNKEKIISFSLTISSSIMLFVSLFDLFPQAFKYINNYYQFIPTIMLIMVYAIVGGLIIDYISNNNNKKEDLYKIGIVSTIALVIHNIPEGIITFISSTKNINIGISLAISIALHNIPEGMVIGVPIYYSTNSKKATFLYTIIAALSEPLGALISLLFIKTINDYFYAVILSFTIGIMIYISLFELLRESLKMANKRILLIYYLFGILIIILSKIII